MEYPIRNDSLHTTLLLFGFVGPPTQYIYAAMGFPSSPTSKIRSRNDISAVSSLLSSSHAGHYLLWSAAEESVDASLFQQQVIELAFPGFPAPPLGLLFKICTSIENWLAADPENVAVIYCMVRSSLACRAGFIVHCALLSFFDIALRHAVFYRYTITL